MGQKINPIGLRLGINRTWDSRWFAEKGEYAKLMHEDVAIRAALMKQLKQAAVSKIVIERPPPEVPRHHPLGSSGRGDRQEGRGHREAAQARRHDDKADVTFNIVEVRKPEVDATLVAESIAQQLERRVAFRRAMKRAVQSAMRLGAEGIRINCAGRLGGAEIARTEWYREGRVPLHTLRADVDYGTATAFTTYGTCGIKVWVFKARSSSTTDGSGQEGQEEGGRSAGVASVTAMTAGAVAAAITPTRDPATGGFERLPCCNPRRPSSVSSSRGASMRRQGRLRAELRPVRAQVP